MSAREQMEKVQAQMKAKKTQSGTRRETPLSKAAARNNGKLPVSKEKPVAKAQRVSASSYCKELLLTKKMTDEQIAAAVTKQFKDFSGVKRVCVIRSCMRATGEVIPQLTADGPKSKKVVKVVKKQPAPAAKAKVVKLSRVPVK